MTVGRGAGTCLSLSCCFPGPRTAPCRAREDTRPGRPHVPPVRGPESHMGHPASETCWETVSLPPGGPSRWVGLRAGSPRVTFQAAVTAPGFCLWNGIELEPREHRSKAHTYDAVRFSTREESKVRCPGPEPYLSVETPETHGPCCFHRKTRLLPAPLTRAGPVAEPPLSMGGAPQKAWVWGGGEERIPHTREAPAKRLLEPRSSVETQDIQRPH